MNIQSLSSSRRYTIIFILGLLSAIGPFSIDMYLPAFDTISKDFDTTVAQIQLSLTSFFIGIAIGQIIYGPLLDRFGRKKPLIFGLSLYIVMSILCAYTTDANLLIFYRFVQALGSCAGMVAGRAMVRDFFEPKEAAKVFSMLMLVIGISPILAPSVGAFVLINFDWHIIFVVLAIIAILILLAVIFILPESFSGNKQMSMAPKNILGNYVAVFKHPTFLLYAMVGGFASSGLYAYLSGSPFVMQNIFSLDETQYSTTFALVASALILATQINRIMLNRSTSEQISTKASFVQASTGIVMIIVTSLGWIDLVVFLALIYIYLGAQGFIFPNTSAMALAPFGKLAGSASALLGCIQMSLGALTSALVSYLHDGTALPMVGVMGLSALISYLAYTFLPKFLKSSDGYVGV